MGALTPHKWQYVDEQEQLFFPWYTRPFLNILQTWNVSSWSVFEYGGGNSTLWWRRKAKLVHSVDTNKDWAAKIDMPCVTDKQDFLKYPLSTEHLYDCIVIDGEPVAWRDECTAYAIKALKPNGIIIIDNYEQATVQLQNWPLTDKLLEKFEKHVYKQPDHQDWKTAYWM